MKKVYYFDLVKVNTELNKNIITDLIDFEYLRKLCGSAKVYKAGKLLKSKNLNCCLILCQATDEAILYIQKFDLCRHTISRIEVARDIQFSSKEEAIIETEEFQKHHLMKFSNGNFRYGNTYYMGKVENEFSSIYNVSYVPLKPKLCKMNIFHDEFVIRLIKNIKRILQIKCVYDLKPAEEHYNELFEKYIVKAKVNHTRFNKYFPNKNVNNIEQMLSVVLETKKILIEKKYKNIILNLICDRRMKEMFGVKKYIQYTDREKLILNQGSGYWTGVRILDKKG